MPTSANKRCGLVLRPIVPCVKLRPHPAAAPAAACKTAIAAKSRVIDSSANAAAAIAKLNATASRPRVRLKRRAKYRLLVTAPTKKSVTKPPACWGSSPYLDMSVPTHTGSATKSTMPAQCATVKAAIPVLLSVLTMPLSPQFVAQMGWASAIIDSPMILWCCCLSPPVISISPRRPEFSTTIRQRSQRRA